MNLKKSVLSKMASVPLPMWILTIIMYILPFLFDHPGGGPKGQIWLIYIFPAFILSFYWGIWGGLIVALLSIIIQICSGFPPPFPPPQGEWGMQHPPPPDFGRPPGSSFMIITTTSLLSFGLAICIGLLADRLKKVQKIVEKNNGELEKKNKQLNDMLHKDELTGLWNRRGLLKWANGSKDKHFSVLFIDLDKFKPVNDTYGHQIGDLLLQDVSKRLKKCVTKEAVISRIGGDEFIILLPQLPQASGDYSIQIAKKINHELSDVFLIDGKEIFITSSIGISLPSDERNDVELLLQKADIAMYNVKRKGKNSYLIFTQPMKDISEARITLDNQLRKAIAKEEFSLYYQPQLDLTSGEIAGVEGLIRWNLDDQIISPAEFIPFAEETGLILSIGKWVLETACNQIKEWRAKDYLPLHISVNVSSLQFQQFDFVQTVQKILQETKIDPRFLRLELTESVLLDHGKDIIDKLTKLKILGVSLSIDDFGSGYSSLTYLKSFPIDEIKMDKSFISEMPLNARDCSLVRSIIHLVHSMDVKIVAEGVETEEQLAFLKEAGCDLVQGYLVGKPAPVQDIERNVKLFSI